MRYLNRTFFSDPHRRINPAGAGQIQHSVRNFFPVCISWRWESSWSQHRGELRRNPRRPSEWMLERIAWFPGPFEHGNNSSGNNKMQFWRDRPSDRPLRRDRNGRIVDAIF